MVLVLGGQRIDKVPSEERKLKQTRRQDMKKCNALSNCTKILSRLFSFCFYFLWEFRFTKQY